MVGSSKKLYVYYDERYPYSWIPYDIAKIIAGELGKYDFEAIDANSLKNILSEGSKTIDKEYVVVFAQDVVPDLILDNPNNPTANSPIRSFLNAGHSIVWIGDVPLYYVGTIDRGKVNTPNAMQNVLGINSNFIDTNKPVMLTEHGIIFGLLTWVGTRPHLSPVSQRNPIPLARAIDNQQYWHSFVVPYKQAQAPFGFIRIYDFPINKADFITEHFIKGLLSVAIRDFTTTKLCETKVKMLSEKVSRIAEELDTKFSTLKSEIDSLKTMLDQILKLEKEILEANRGKTDKSHLK